MNSENTIQRAADDLYLLTKAAAAGGEGWFISLIVVLGKGIGLMDTGYADTPELVLFPFLERMNRSPAEITMVVNTHRDSDHVGGNAIIRERSGARIAIHKLEAESVESPDVFLTDGDEVTLGDRIFEVIHTPGHKPGSICLYERSARILLTGDTVTGTRRDLIRMDPEIQIRSLERLQDLDLELMIMAHPFEPAGKAVLDASEAREMIRTSIRIVRSME
jgi:glyoxylase-like metal-dependent hydrolase (beta-lactamase superfamily II)